MHITLTLKQVNGWLCHLEMCSHTPCWIWSTICKWDNIMVHEWKYLLHTFQVVVLNSALCDSSTWTWTVVVSEPMAVRFKKFKSTLDIWILCCDLLDLFVIKDAFILRQTSWCGLNVPLFAIGLQPKKGVGRFSGSSEVGLGSSQHSLHK